MKIMIIVLQIIFIHVFLLLGNLVKMIIPLPIPASMVGLLLLLLALAAGIVKLEWVEQGGNWLLAELLLFFIPSAIGIVNYDEMFTLQGIESVLLVGISTFIVISTTAYIAEKILNGRKEETIK